MIRLITSDHEFINLPQPTSHHEYKIKSLYEAYGISSGICRFYLIGSPTLAAIAADMDSCLIIAGVAEPDLEELASFIGMTAPIKVDMPAKLGESLKSRLSDKYKAEYSISLHYHPPKQLAFTQVNDSPKLDDAYKIISSSFEGIEYNSWYVDISHRVRHGISKVYTYMNATTCTMQYNLDGKVFLSQIATLPTERGKGYASKLVSHVAGIYSLEGKDVWLNCKEDKLTFYENIGFVNEGKVCALTKLGGKNELFQDR